MSTGPHNLQRHPTLKDRQLTEVVFLVAGLLAVGKFHNTVTNSVSNSGIALP